MAKENQTRKSKFYFGNEQLVRDAGSLSMFTPLGTRDAIASRVVGGNSNTYQASYKALPGIAVLDYEVVPGRSINAFSPINIAGKKLYTFVRHINSGSRNYDSTDLLEYVFAVISAYTFIAQCVRAYGATLRYASTNRYFGQNLVEALGFDYSNISTNLADFRSAINVAIAKLNALKIPGDWNLLTKSLALNLGLYKDGDINKSQIYAFKSTTVWVWNATGTYIGSLTPSYPFGTNGHTKLQVSAVRTILDSILTPIVGDEDMNIMSGDILKAYGDKCYSMDFIPEGLVIEPMYDKDVLTLFHNVHFTEYGKTYAAKAGNIIYQENNVLLFEPVVAGAQDYIGYDTGLDIYFCRDGRNTYMDFDTDDVKPFDVMLAGEGCNSMQVPYSIKSTYNSDPDSENYYYSFSNELFSCLHIYFIDAAGLTYTDITTTEIARNATFYPVLDTWVELLSKFDWCPLLYVYGVDENKGDPEWYPNVFGDMYNYTLVAHTDLYKIHQAAILASMNIE